jgi:hypothetical protein
MAGMEIATGELVGYCNCGNKGTWLYMPSYGGIQHNDYYCDYCVPRGCSCNQEEDGTEPFDEQGRKYPCCEFFTVDE